MKPPNPVTAEMSPGPPPVPGEFLLAEEPIEINPGRDVVTLHVENTGDRPVQVGSHLHLAEANAALDLDRDAAWGRRLAVPAGTSVRFEPGLAQDVDTVAIGGRRIVAGARGLAAGPLDRSEPVDRSEQ
jgi:urease subunit beta